MVPLGTFLVPCDAGTVLGRFLPAEKAVLGASTLGNAVFSGVFLGRSGDSANACISLANRA
jgi:hypothetical protein